MCAMDTAMQNAQNVRCGWKHWGKGKNETAKLNIWSTQKRCWAENRDQDAWSLEVIFGGRPGWASENIPMCIKIPDTPS